jgi:hypothetical protein
MSEEVKAERNSTTVGDRVVIWADGKEVADGRVEAWDGVPDGLECGTLRCVAGTCIVDGILTRPGFDDVPLAIRDPENPNQVLGKVKRWIFPLDLVKPYGIAVERPAASDSKKRKSQTVVSTVNKRKVLKWMIEEEKINPNKLYTRTIKEFPTVFNSRPEDYNANIQKVKDWWKKGPQHHPDLYVSDGARSRLLRFISILPGYCWNNAVGHSTPSVTLTMTLNIEILIFTS